MPSIKRPEKWKISIPTYSLSGGERVSYHNWCHGKVRPIKNCFSFWILLINKNFKWIASNSITFAMEVWIVINYCTMCGFQKKISSISFFSSRIPNSQPWTFKGWPGTPNYKWIKLPTLQECRMKSRRKVPGTNKLHKWESIKSNEKPGTIIKP